MGLKIGIVDKVITPTIFCDVCNREIEKERDGIVLLHDVGGLLDHPRVWFSHKGCMGPSTDHISIELFIKRLARSVGMDAEMRTI